jgi:hypothetical protein
MSEPTPETIQPALLTIPQVCEYLNIKRATFYKINATGAFGLLPEVLYSRTELESYLKESTAQGKLIPRKEWQIMKKDKL